nr:MAG TPA: hypothetical protein [Caudoviricetes sp.]
MYIYLLNYTILCSFRSFLLKCSVNPAESCIMYSGSIYPDERKLE